MDWQKPFAWQVGHLGEKYNEWVHQPVDQPIRLFESEFLEARTQAACNLTHMPIYHSDLFCLFSSLAVFLPHLSGSVLRTYSHVVFVTFGLGMFLWFFMVYCMHFLLHQLPSSNYYFITLHFLLHGHHHKSPHDRLQTVFPPILAFLLFAGLFLILQCLLPVGLDMSMLLGLICGYVISDMVHYYLHHSLPSTNAYFHDIRTIHMKHHFEQPHKGLGIATTTWDWVFNTVILP
ncbi:hypothetical protein ACEWY4_011114 [Coilia grayii]|uniref:Fatty acid hydroxylase domain-containing protein n=1 Tax=Coilia grayii TaxID=363190 RepID=A0ABD1K3T9_9TELE